MSKKDMKKKGAAIVQTDESALIGKNRSFAITEAHKRLRTNVLFSLPDESECRVIGVTSAMAHEGKSTTSLNLAYDLAQAGKKVLLLDADMRLSKVAKQLDVNRAPGLSNMLVGEDVVKVLVQHSPKLDNLSVITCGEIPPNPTELLASKRMEALVEALKKTYKYIIIDCPPISAVSDALIISKLTDGMIVVARQDYVDRRLLDDAIRQLRLNDANIIGFVMNCAQSESKYYNKKYYKYKYKKYGYGYRYKYYRYGGYYKK